MKPTSQHGYSRLQMAESGHEDEHATLLGDEGLRAGGQVLKLGYGFHLLTFTLLISLRVHVCFVCLFVTSQQCCVEKDMYVCVYCMRLLQIKNKTRLARNTFSAKIVAFKLCPS